MLINSRKKQQQQHTNIRNPQILELEQKILK
jgi:hypothetical protein